METTRFCQTFDNLLAIDHWSTTWEYRKKSIRNERIKAKVIRSYAEDRSISELASSWLNYIFSTLGLTNLWMQSMSVGEVGRLCRIHLHDPVMWCTKIWNSIKKWLIGHSIRQWDWGHDDSKQIFVLHDSALFLNPIYKKSTLIIMNTPLYRT